MSLFDVWKPGMVLDSGVLVCRLFDVWRPGMVLDIGFFVCRLFDVWRLKLGECWTLGFSLSFV